MSSERKMGTDSVLKLMFLMGLPVMLAQVVNLLYNIVDRIYIGKIDASLNATAAIGVAAPLINVISALAAFVSGGGAPLAAKALGMNDYKRANKILGNGFIMLVCFSLLIMVGFYTFLEPLLYFVGADANSYSYAYEYLTIYLVGTFFVQIAIGLNTFITAQGKSLLAMIAVLVGAVINFILDPLFIFKFEMGIKGAALATIISQFISAMVVLIILTRKQNALKLSFKYFKVDHKIILAILALGVSPFVMSITESMIGFVLNGQLKKYGTDYVALLTVFQSVMMLITVPLSGFTNGVTPLISYNYGQRNRQRVLKCFKINCLFCYFYTAIFGALGMIFPSFFAKMFKDSEVIIKLSEELLPIFLIGMLVFGLQRACQSTFVALGKSLISLFIALLRKVILLIPLAMLLPLKFGVNGVFYSEPIADTIAALICTTIFIFVFKKELKLLEN